MDSLFINHSELPLVSVCMITYNHENYISKAIEGVLNQVVDFNIELLIADDNSLDRTKRIVEYYQKNHPKGFLIKYFRHQENIGMSKNFIFTLLNCRGKFIAYCEGDDFWIDPYKLQKQTDILTLNPEYGFCWARSLVLNEKSSTLKEDPNFKFLDDKNQKGFEFTFNILQNGWFMVMQTLFFRKDLILDLNQWEYTYFKDIHLIVHLLEKQVGYCLNDFLAVYRIHSGGVHTSRSNLLKAENGYKTYKELQSRKPGNTFIKVKLYSFSNQYLYELINKREFKKAFLHCIEISLLTKSPRFFITYIFQFMKSIFKVS